MSDLPPSDSWPDDELVSQVDGLIDGHLDPETQRRLEERLRHDPAAADYCAERILFHSKLSEMIGPSRLELIQNRRLVIEGHGDARRVIIGQSHTAQIGGHASPLGLPGGPVQPAARKDTILWVVLGSMMVLLALLAFLVLRKEAAPEPTLSNSAAPWHRKPDTEGEKRYWLQNMAWHQFNLDEMKAATGLEKDEIAADLERFRITPEPHPAPRPGQPLFVLPYPGGKHPRIGLQEQAVNPQRDTKISVFTPWDPSSYVVLDLPEAVYTTNFLYYLSHSDMPTIWSLQGMQLQPVEWERLDDGRLKYTRELPNGVSFGAEVEPRPSELRLTWWIHNDTATALRDILIQNCVLLGAAEEFSAQTPDNKLFANNYAVCRSPDGDHWAISGWANAEKLWGLHDSPCMHADPFIEVCQPGQKIVLHGWFSYYEGTDIEGELERIDSLGWRQGD